MAIEKLSKDEIEAVKQFPSLLEEYILITEAMGTFVRTMGNIEKKNPDLFVKMKQFGSPENLETFVKVVPPEILGLLFKTMIRFARLSQIKDIMALSPDEKIQVGEEMEAVSKDLMELLKRIRKDVNVGP